MATQKVEIFAYRPDPRYTGNERRPPGPFTGGDDGSPKQQYLPAKYNSRSQLETAIEGGSGEIIRLHPDRLTAQSRPWRQQTMRFATVGNTWHETIRPSVIGFTLGIALVQAAWAPATEPPIQVVLGKPVPVILAPPNEKRWGFYQFPSLMKTAQDDVVASCNVCDDSHAGAGEQHPSPFAVTRDGGKTWKPLDNPSTIQWARILRDGTEIQSAGRPRRLAKELGIHPVVERFSDHYGCQLDLYRYEDLPADLRGMKIVIRKPNGTRQEFVASVDAPRMLVAAHRRTQTSAGPVELEGHIYPLTFDFNSTAFIELPDGTLLYVHKFMRLDERGKLLPGECHTYLLASKTGQKLEAAATMP